MHNIGPNKVQKLSMEREYSLYLGKGPSAKDKLSNVFNIFDDLNIKDKVIMQKTRGYISVNKADAQFARTIKGKSTPKIGVEEQSRSPSKQK